MDSFTALADPTRRSIVELLAAGERSAGDVAARFSISQPAVSRHLRLLRESGLVTVRPVAQLRMYALEPQELDELAEWLERTRRLWEQRFDRMDDAIRHARLQRVASPPGDSTTAGRTAVDRAAVDITTADIATVDLATADLATVDTERGGSS